MTHRRLKDIEDHLERADARYERFIKIQAIEKAKRDRSRRIKVAVAIFALICGAYAFASSVNAQSVFDLASPLNGDPAEHLVMGNPSNAVTDVNTPLNYLIPRNQYVLSL